MIKQGFHSSTLDHESPLNAGFLFLAGLGLESGLVSGSLEFPDPQRQLPSLGFRTPKNFLPNIFSGQT